MVGRLQWWVAALLAASAAGCALSPVRAPAPALAAVAESHGGISNFVWVTSTICRGSQPDRTGFDYLWSQGIRTIVKLDTEGQGNDSYAEALGMRVIRIPISSWAQLFGPVPVARIDTAAATLPEHSFIHCQHGQDRTGLFCYRYRRLHGWSPEDARGELLQLGFHPSLRALWASVKED